MSQTFNSVDQEFVDSFLDALSKEELNLEEDPVKVRLLWIEKQKILRSERCIHTLRTLAEACRDHWLENVWDLDIHEKITMIASGQSKIEYIKDKIADQYRCSICGEDISRFHYLVCGD